MKDIPGFEGKYAITEDGRVWSHWRRGGWRKIQTHRLGYKNVMFCLDGKVKNFYVHRLVATAFIPNPENKLEINHKDGNKENNHISNLEWSDRSSNVKHAFKKGLLKPRRGKFNKKTKLLESEVIQIKKIGKLNLMTNTEIAKKFNVHRTTIRDILSGKNWHYLD